MGSECQNQQIFGFSSTGNASGDFSSVFSEDSSIGNRLRVLITPFLGSKVVCELSCPLLKSAKAPHKNDKMTNPENPFQGGL